MGLNGLMERCLLVQESNTCILRNYRYRYRYIDKVRKEANLGYHSYPFINTGGKNYCPVDSAIF